MIPVALIFAAHIVGQQCNCADLERRVAALEAEVKALKDRPAPSAGTAPSTQDKAYDLPAGNSPSRGDPKAPIVITLFGDHQCPFTARAFPVLMEAVSDPALKGKVRLVYKAFPLSFHQNAKWAAKVAFAAGEQGKFFEMSDVLFANQRDLNEDALPRFAQEAGVDLAKLQHALRTKDGDYEERIRQDTKLGMEKAHVRGTPSIYVGGWELRTRSIDGIKDLIAEKKL
jgi:protein-disulfide isomerase